MSPNPREAAGLGGSDALTVGFEAFLGIADLWDLTTEEQMKILGSPARSTFFKWKKDGGPLPGDIGERISHILSIYKCLQILFTTEERADQWIKKPNRFFDGTSALDVMLGGQVVDLVKVREYLDAQRGG
jgi:uncharacterized protein (DUF2384 family)